MIQSIEDSSGIIRRCLRVDVGNILERKKNFWTNPILSAWIVSNACVLHETFHFIKLLLQPFPHNSWWIDRSAVMQLGWNLATYLLDIRIFFVGFFWPSSFICSIVSNQFDSGRHRESNRTEPSHSVFCRSMIFFFCFTSTIILTSTDWNNSLIFLTYSDLNSTRIYWRNEEEVRQPILYLSERERYENGFEDQCDVYVWYMFDVYVRYVCSMYMFDVYIRYRVSTYATSASRPWWHWGDELVLSFPINRSTRQGHIVAPPPHTAGEGLYNTRLLQGWTTRRSWARPR